MNAEAADQKQNRDESKAFEPMKKSWEAELLISGGALFTIWQAGSGVAQLLMKVMVINFFPFMMISWILFAYFF